jgi:glucokinase
MYRLSLIPTFVINLTQLEFRLLQYLMRKFEQKHRISVERVVSGTGLANVRAVLWDASIELNSV